MFSLDFGRKPIEGLSQKELVNLHLRTQGLNAKEIAKKLCRSVSTIISHDKSIMRKLEAKTMGQAIHNAHKRGYLN